MSTFERAKRNLLADMKGCSVHTAESWAHMMLKHTANIRSDEDQARFWQFMLNPNDDEAIPPPVLTPITHELEAIPKTVSAPVPGEEKESVELQNECHREGMTTYIRTVPKKVTETLLLSPADPALLPSATGDEKATGIS